MTRTRVWFREPRRADADGPELMLDIDGERFLVPLGEGWDPLLLGFKPGFDDGACAPPGRYRLRDGCGRLLLDIDMPTAIALAGLT